MVNIQKIKDIAKEKGVSLSYISRTLGKRRTFISEVSCGKDQIDTEEIIQIANILDTSVDYLTDKTDKKEKPTEYDGLSEKQKVIMDFVMSVPDDKAEMILRVMKSILEADK